MKVTTETMIGRQVVVQELDTHGIKIYSSIEDDTLFLCKGEKVIATISLLAYSGEGGGGSFEIEKVSDNG